ncbi:seminal metalloprotease 1-like [Arctopsyche grandis]|uniref:seminal metalloprotease 1-like n=1 Tax=Arctopsyche grandis TaxID=121162 RepID=UPI00406D790E
MNNFLKYALILSITLTYQCCGIKIARTTEEIRKYAAFLKATVHGKSEEPLNPQMAKFQNAWERSGAFEGDIILTKEQREALIAEYSGMKNSVLSAISLWPNNTMYYHIDERYFTPDQVTLIQKSIDILQKVSCVKIKRRTSNINDYVLIQGADGGCRSKVGYTESGAQILNLNPSKVGTGCFKQGTIIHELLHSLGFYHMQSTYDRDDFVNIVWNKIKPGHEFNFNKYTSSQVTNLGVKYDYSSVLHYSEYSFSIDGSKTIIPIQKTNITIGQREMLSEGDIIKLNKRYKCPGF